MSKGSKRRPRSPRVSREEYDLRWVLLYGEITGDEFIKRMKDIKDKENVSP